MSIPANIGGIVAPDLELARKAFALAERAHSKTLLNHVHRTWWFAELLGKKREMKYDRELVYLASLLHDLGLSDGELWAKVGDGMKGKAAYRGGA